LGRGGANRVLSVGVALSAVFWLPGMCSTDGWSAAATTPSNGPLRVIWCLLLLAILRGIAARQRLHQRAGWLGACGSVVWLIGGFWSFESAIYCSAVWLPAYAMLAFDEHAGDSARASSAARLQRGGGRAAGPPSAPGGWA